jgi:thiamine biosynthesis lipoprotein
MATTYSVKVVVRPESGLGEQHLRAMVEPELRLVNERMSRYDPQSEIGRFNRLANDEPFPASVETLDVLARAREISELTDGALDVTVGPLIRLWGFHGRVARERAPDAGVLDAVREQIGFRRLEIDRAAGTLRKRVPELDLDLSAIAKGYGVDRVAVALERAGHERFLVEVGGEVRCRGANLHGEPWRVAVEKPVAEGREIFEVVPLVDRAMATSGDYRNFYRIGARWVSHTVDPRNGRPVEHGLASVTVVHDECMFADGLATALTVLGTARGSALAAERGLAVMFIERRPDGTLERVATPRFEALHEDIDRLTGGRRGISSE